MLELSKLVYLIIFPGGTEWIGLKQEDFVPHGIVLKDMQEKNKDFFELTKYLDIEDKKEQFRLYISLVKMGAIVYHSWTTCLEEPESDMNIYLPKTITPSQKEILDSLKEQIPEDYLLISSALIEENGHDKLTEISLERHEMTVDKLDEYIGSHMLKVK